MMEEDSMDVDVNVNVSEGNELQSCHIDETRPTPVCNFNVVIDIEDGNQMEAIDNVDDDSETDFEEEVPEESIAELEMSPNVIDDESEKADIPGNSKQVSDPAPIVFPVSSQVDNPDEKRRKGIVDSFKRLNPSEKIFPAVRPSNFHTVAFVVTEDYKPGDALIPHPSKFIAKWDPKYVPMPCCQENVKIYKIRAAQTGQGSSNSNATADDQEKKLPVLVEKAVSIWDRIEMALLKPMHTTIDLSNAIKFYTRCSEEFAALEYAIDKLMTSEEFDRFFAKVLPFMRSLCLDVAKYVTCPIPLLCKFQNYSVSFSQKQIASLLACAFFSTFPKRLENDHLYPDINFIRLFSASPNDPKLATKANKIRCIIHYFERISEEMPKGVVTFTRKFVRSVKTTDWSASMKKLSAIIPLLQGTIETDGAGMLQVDFANKIIGGGVLGQGAVQEEILFVIYPELLITRLFTEKLTSCEAVVITGCERFCKYAGYATGFQYAGDFYDCTPWDSKGRKCTQIVAIDALYITEYVSQFQPLQVKRELNKAHVGFSSPTATSVAIATGKWGCGAFHGDPQLKAIIQLLAASQAGRDIVFFTFDDVALQKDIEAMYDVIKDMTIKEVFNLLIQYNRLFCTTPTPRYSLAEFLLETGAGSLVFQDSGDFEPDPPVPDPPVKKLSAVPIENFYVPSSNRLPPKDLLVEDPMEEDWQTKMERLKSSFSKAKTKKPSDPTATLTESQITSLLEDDTKSQMDSNSGLGNCAGQSTSSAVRPAAEEYRTIFQSTGTTDRPKRDRPSCSFDFNGSRSDPKPADAEKQSPSCNTPPKQRKQTTLRDFFK